MKKIRRALATITLGSTLLVVTGSIVQVRADDTGGPQGQQDSKPKGPSTSSGTVDAQVAYILWLIGRL